MDPAAHVGDADVLDRRRDHVVLPLDPARGGAFGNRSLALVLAGDPDRRADPALQAAVDDGDSVSSDEAVREAFVNLMTKRALQPRELDVLKADIDRGLADLADVWMQDFGVACIIECRWTL